MVLGAALRSPSSDMTRRLFMSVSGGRHEAADRRMALSNLVHLPFRLLKPQSYPETEPPSLSPSFLPCAIGIKVYLTAPKDALFP